MKPTIVLVGRPNVGKSTLFNRLTKSRQAIVVDEPGVTRDRHFGHGRVGDKPYWVVDTGGFEIQPNHDIVQQSIRQTLRAIDEADAVIFLLDAQAGITAQDKLLADALRKYQGLLFLVTNKSEGMTPDLATAEFYELGLGQPYAISAAHGHNIRELMLLILENFVTDEALPINKKHPIFAIIGRPNVGKSTLANTMLGEERVITFDKPGTTRDSIFIDFSFKDRSYTLIDTAGMRRKNRINQTIEKFSILKTLRAMNEANVALLMLDAKEVIADQDGAIAKLALEAGCALVIAINKWDDISQTEKNTLKQALQQKLAFLNFAKFHYISALNGSGILEIFQSIDEAYAASNIKLPTPKLTKVLIEATKIQMPSRVGRIIPKLRYAHQGGNLPPIIVIHGNALQLVSKNYTRFLENRFRQAFRLVGTPLKIQYKSGINPYHKKKTVSKK
jgi:GTP-binding protein